MPYILQRMTEDDAPLTVNWMVRQYGFDRAEVESWVQDLHFNWPLSVKALDENGHVIGLLNMSDYRIEEETPQILKDKPELIKSLNTTEMRIPSKGEIVRTDTAYQGEIVNLTLSLGRITISP